MANLVPLNLDKDTGDLVARTPTNVNEHSVGFLFTQSTPSTSWTVVHNQNTLLMLTQIYDETGEFTLPNEILIVDVNTVQVNFTAAMAGTAHLIFFRNAS